MDKKKPIITISTIIIVLIVFFTISKPHTGTIIVANESPSPIVEKSVPNLKVFLENSGSMYGYLAPGGQLKDAVYDYVSELALVSDTLRFYYINSVVIPRPADMESYIKNLTPSSFVSAGGNHANTDIGQIVKSVLNETHENDVSLLISDFILDLPNKDADNFLIQKSIQIKNAIRDKLQNDPNFGVVIIRMESEYTGKYFYPNGTTEQLTKEMRPYYIWMFGNKEYLVNINLKAPFNEIKHGFTNFVSYKTETDVPFDVSNLSMTSKIIKAKQGLYEILIQADYTPTLQPESAIVNTDYYQISSDDAIIDEIAKITSTDGFFNYYISLSIDQNSTPQEICVSFEPPLLPNWVSKYNDDEATNILENIEKTTGIKALINGVAEAYKTRRISTVFKIQINKRD